MVWTPGNEFRGAGGRRVPSFIDQRSMPVPFRLKFDGTPDREELSEAAASLTKSARRRLERALAVLNTPGNWISKDVRGYAKRYFLIEEFDEGIANQRVKPILEQTWNGLGAASLVVEFKKDVAFLGAVERSPGEAANVTNLEFGGKVVYGTIQVAQRLVESRKSQGLAVVTIIHEATHKFAGTWDYCYFEDDGSEARTPSVRRNEADSYTPVQTDSKKGFTSQNKALQNADSFAWFAYQIGRK